MTLYNSIKNKFIYKTAILLATSTLLTSCTFQDHMNQSHMNQNHMLPSIDSTFTPTEIAQYSEIADIATLEQGRHLYNTYCTACHGINGEGQFPNTINNTDSSGRYGAPPHNETGHTWNHPDTTLIQYIKNGKWTNPDEYLPMPAFSNLSDQEITAIISYIKTMWTDEQRDIQARNSLEANSIIK